MKTSKFIYFLLLGLLCVSTLAACGGDKHEQGDQCKYGAWTIIKVPTCTEEGQETRTCTQNHLHTETRAIEALGHNWGSWTVTKSATCEEKGEEMRVCLRDSSHKETRPVDELDHEWSEWEVTKEPTAAEMGEEIRFCLHDPSHVETRPISRLKITVSFEKNGGIGDANDIEVAYNSPYGVLPVLTKDGYVFGGWWIQNDDGSVQAISSGLVGQTVSHTLYAKWYIIERVTLSAGDYHSLRIDEGGNLWAWGSNEYGQLGDGTTVDRNSPVKIKEGTKFSAVSAGGGYSLAIDTDGNLWAWGRNDYGQLGDGTVNDKHSPVKINGEIKFRSISVGLEHSLAIDAGFRLWAWGSGSSGQLGNNSSLSFSRNPIFVKSGIAAISAGYEHSLAIDTDGYLWASGLNSHGQLGTGIIGNQSRFYPVFGFPIAGSRKFSIISAGGEHSLAIDMDGNLWAWGYNEAGQLGDGTTADRNTPVIIKEDTKFSAVSGGRYHSTAIDEDGNLWAWGHNIYGQLGDEATSGSMINPLPILIKGDTKFSAVFAGKHYTLAIDTNGNLCAWGSNEYGQLGN